jgi:hypothetical protein
VSSDKLLPIPRGYTQRDYQQQARLILRSICRIYLTDFLCLNYTLPADCEDMKMDWQVILQDEVEV